MLKIQFDDGGVVRSLDLAIDSVRDLKPIFKRFAKWMRPEIDKVFAQQGPGWPALAESTQEAREAKMPALAEKIRSGATNTLGRKLGAESARVDRRLVSRLMTDGGGKSVDRAQKAVARQRLIRQEFERITAGAYGPNRKEAKKLGERVERRQARAEDKIQRIEKGEMLGSIANSIGVDIQAQYMEMFSHIKWAGAHNDGATVGHGTKLRERKFLQWTPERIKKLAEIAEDVVLEKLKGAN